MKRNGDIKRSEKDLKDISNEYSHRLKAGTERLKRDVAGGAMTTRQKAVSALKESGHRVAAEVDKTKRIARDKGR